MCSSFIKFSFTTIRMNNLHLNNYWFNKIIIRCLILFSGPGTQTSRLTIYERMKFHYCGMMSGCHSFWIHRCFTPSQPRRLISRARQNKNVFLPKVKIFNTQSTGEDWRKFRENEIEWAGKAATSFRIMGVQINAVSLYISTFVNILACHPYCLSFTDSKGAHF